MMREELVEAKEKSAKYQLLLKRVGAMLCYWFYNYNKLLVDNVDKGHFMNMVYWYKVTSCFFWLAHLMNLLFNDTAGANIILVTCQIVL